MYFYGRLVSKFSYSTFLSRSSFIPSVYLNKQKLQTLQLYKNCNTYILNFKTFSTIENMAPILQDDAAVENFISEKIKEHNVMIFSKSFCPFCIQVKELFKKLQVEYHAIEIDHLENGGSIQRILTNRTGLPTVPNVFIKMQSVGGWQETVQAHEDGMLLPLIFKRNHSYDYDLVVIGGGSGGLAASKEAANLGAKVAVCDFVKPTPKGTTWGLGGTCVNVGCIPKKLMHRAAILGHDLKDSSNFGWETPESVKHDWRKMIESVQDHIGSLNWGYRVALRNKNVEYLNSFSTFVDSHYLKTVDRKGKEKIISADNFLIAIGGRPRYPDVPGAKECCITSDDLFSLPYAPQKTLCIGASYISLECAGFLAGLGYDVTVMVRSILLRGFDQQMAEKIGEYMASNGVKFIRGAVPTSFEQIEEGMPGRIRVKGKMVEGNEEIEDEFNTVILAIGRDPFTKDIGLDAAGVQLAKSEKIIVDNKEQTSVPNIYAVGDVIEGGLELTPVAIQAGKLLAKRLFGNSKLLTDYVNVPTTVFTPLEYGCCGLSEEKAIAQYGEDDIEVYHANLWPLEFTVPHRPENDCYVKLICVKSENDRVIGFHVLSPDAGEITQGFSIALKLNATKADFDNLIGIHPTCAEIFTTLSITKRSGLDISAGGC